MWTRCIAGLLLATGGAQDTASVPSPLVVADDPYVTEQMRKVEGIRGRKFLSAVELKTADRAVVPSDSIAARISEEMGRDLVAFAAFMGQELPPHVDGFYDPRTRSITVTRYPAGPVRDALVRHELCHALDDQHFDFERRLRSLRPSSYDAVFVEMAIVEASASEGGNGMVDLLENVTEKELEAATSGAHSRPSARPRSEVASSLRAGLYEIAWRAGRRLIDEGARRTRRSRAEVVDDLFRRPPHCARELLSAADHWERRPHAQPALELPDLLDLEEQFTRVASLELGAGFLNALVLRPGNRPRELFERVAAPTPEQLWEAMREDMKQPWREFPASLTASLIADRAWILEERNGDRALVWFTLWKTAEDASALARELEGRNAWWCGSEGTRAVAVADFLPLGGPDAFCREVGARALRAVVIRP